VLKEKPAWEGFYNRFVKRWLDLVIAGILVLILWPVMLAISLAVALEDGFPVIYRAPRCGRLGKTFRICKFRTMVKNADRIGGGTTALHDPRITKVGAFLRKTKLDELPQLLQVLTGTMSLVGPRPELPAYTDRYVGEELDILQVRPGITDFSSVEFASLDEIVGETNADEVYEQHVLPRKNALRVQYAHRVSFWVDAKLLWKTAGTVLGKMLGLRSKRGT